TQPNEMWITLTITETVSMIRQDQRRFGTKDGENGGNRVYFQSWPAAGGGVEGQGPQERRPRPGFQRGHRHGIGCSGLQPGRDLVLRGGRGQSEVSAGCPA